MPVQAFTAHNIYQEEFKALQSKPSYKILLDRRTDKRVQVMIADIENAHKVGFFGSLMRNELIFQGGVAIAADEMPQLHSYIRMICEHLGMRIPTLYITKDKNRDIVGGCTNQADSVKWAMSSGAILIGRDLLLEVSQKALEAAVARELFRINRNHDNKQYFMFWAIPGIITLLDSPVNGLATMVIARFLAGKHFEAQADRFVYETQNNAEGLIDLCGYWQKGEQKVDDDYGMVYRLLHTKTLSFFEYESAKDSYIQFYVSHLVNKAWRWIKRNTILTTKSTYASRIQAAQKYINISS